jgi:hypothetical protein
VEKNAEKKLIKLKDDLASEKKSIQDIDELANETIDKNWPSPPLEELSERELETLLDQHHSRLAKSADPLSVEVDITSPRKLLRKPVIWIKQKLINVVNAYLTPIMRKQTTFNQTAVELYQAMILHQKKLRKKTNRLEERVNECEAHLAIISKKLKELENKFDMND